MARRLSESIIPLVAYVALHPRVLRGLLNGRGGV
jgi:hypothetical protein